MMDDCDLDDAELWAVIDSAAASRSRKPLLTFKNSNPDAPKPFRNPRPIRIIEDDLRFSSDGEVVQDERWAVHRRPQKMPRFIDSVATAEERRMVVVRHPPRSPMVSVSSPETGRLMVKEVSPFVESPSPETWERDDKENVGHSLCGRFPSVAAFKEYQNIALSILEKTDYTMISGRPYVKKTGWRKISCFFNLSFEIKDKSIEFDDKRNVQRAEFVVRAHMQSGRYSDGWGSCERREKNFLKPNHDIPSTAETRAKNKACQNRNVIDYYKLTDLAPTKLNREIL